MIANLQAISESIRSILREVEAIRLNTMSNLKTMELWQKDFIFHAKEILMWRSALLILTSWELSDEF